MIVVVGYANLDVVVRVPRLPRTGQRLHADSIERHAGGMAANAAAAAAVFGGQVCFVGAVGDDPDGAALVQSLADVGVDVAAVRTDATTTTAVVLVDQDGQRTIISQDDAVDAVDVWRALDLVGAGGVLYIDGYRWPWAAQLLQDRPGNLHVLVDLDGVTHADDVSAAASVADHLLCSRDHLRHLVPDRQPEDVARSLASKYDTAVVLTRGRNGWWRTDAHREDEARGVAVQSVDSTGAGDAFAGVFAACLDDGSSPVAALAWANAAAALSTTGDGARGRLPDRAATATLLEG